MIKEKVIDTHLHIEAFTNDESTFIDCFESYKNSNRLHAFNICVVPTKQRSACNNMMAGFYKLKHPNTYAHLGVDHIKYPVTDDMPQGMDLVTQYKELMALGFDGVKMLDAKPSHLKRIGGDLLCPPLERLFAEIEKDQTHLLLHSNDPDEFWDESQVFPDQIEKGWFYGDGTHETYEGVYKQTEKMLEKFPKIKVTLAHFYFCGKNPNKLISLFEKYPNLCVDITQGGEMYVAFEPQHDYIRELFTKYSSRIMLGTDCTYPWGNKVYDWLIDRTYRFIATNDVMMAFNDHTLTGINLPKEARENILYKNFERRVGKNPRPINKKRLLAYVEKYKCLLSETEWSYIEPHYIALKKELGE